MDIRFPCGRRRSPWNLGTCRRSRVELRQALVRNPDPRRGRIKGVSARLETFAEVASEQVSRWAAAERVPYAESKASAWEPEFWKAVSRILTTAIRVDPPRALTPTDATEENVESLYEAIVRPRQDRSKKRTRIDTAVKQTLGGYAGYFQSRSPVVAFGGAREAVLDESILGYGLGDPRSREPRYRDS